MRSEIAEINNACTNALKMLTISAKLNSEITDFINDCIHFDLFELMRILNDLEKPIAPNAHFEIKNDADDETCDDFMPDIAPELTGDPLYIVTGTQLGIEDDGDEFSEYLENTQEKYQTIKTLLYSDAPKPFYDFYVCNTLTYKVSKGRSSYETKVIKNVTADILSECTNFVIITGTGGFGKSMMMRHLLPDCIEQYSTIEKLPIFIPLKDFDDSFL